MVRASRFASRCVALRRVKSALRAPRRASFTHAQVRLVARERGAVLLHALELGGEAPDGRDDLAVAHLLEGVGVTGQRRVDVAALGQGEAGGLADQDRRAPLGNPAGAERGHGVRHLGREDLRQAEVLLAGSDGKLAERKLKTGLANWEYTEVLEGLAAGERVVTSLEREGVKAGAAFSEAAVAGK